MKTQIDPASLPKAIAEYWAAANAGDSEAAAACFSPDAAVRDEGQRHVGFTAISAWVEETTRNSHPVVEPLCHTEQADRHLVTGRVSGSFPGSPVELDFAFTLKDGRIVDLQIQ